MAEELYDLDDEEVIDGPDSSVMNEVAARFAGALLAESARPLVLDLGLITVCGVPGIASPINKNGTDDPGFLDGALDYTFSIQGKSVPVSLQLYENECYYHRLFAFNRRGMLFSVNLTMGKEEGMLVRLEQQLKIVNGRYENVDLAKVMRQRQRDDLIAVLRALGLQIDDRNWINLGGFDIDSCSFVGTTPEKFLRDFFTVALLKGHFMGNKGYSLI
ncbi:MAG TPA: hypothetical protein VNT01_13500 [Symbiobacteriaceae bacterium]|nr:hypothetical protein [Symbiobacteriaceae bacterium]